MAPNKTITTANKFKGNPRTISKKQFALLKEHIEKLGDLSGVVYCRINKAYVGGNQRSEVFNGCPIEIEKTYDIPTPSKTVAIGHIIYKDERFAYREVEFTEEEFKMACIVANSDGGNWDMDTLYNEWDTDLLKEWGLDIDFPVLDEGIKEPEEEKDKPLSIIIKDIPANEIITLFEEMKERGYQCEIKG